MHDIHGWDHRYAGTERLFPREPDAALVELVGGLRPGRALDLGAGKGRNSLWLARQGWQVTAVDLAEVALGRLATEDRLAWAFPGLEVLRIERRERKLRAGAAPLVDVVAWATRRA